MYSTVWPVLLSYILQYVRCYQGEGVGGEGGVWFLHGDVVLTHTHRLPAFRVHHVGLEPATLAT